MTARPFAIPFAVRIAAVVIMVVVLASVLAVVLNNLKFRQVIRAQNGQVYSFIAEESARTRSKTA
ncbi:MAG: hypothetical protein WDN49_21435 [Acetobacteraceae bacterium]